MKQIKYLEIYIILSIYVFIELFLYKIIPREFSLLINPIFLLFTSIYLFIKTNNNHGRFIKNNEYIKKMLIVILIYIIIYIYMGFIFGFVKSPYSHNIITILKNIWQFIIPIVLIEYIRSSIVNSNNKNKLFIIIITLILFLIEINISNILNNLQDREEGFKYLSSVFIPLFAYNILYTYLSLKGSYKLVLIYRIIYELMFLISPVYPNLDWFATGIMDILMPTIIYIVFKYDFEKRNRNLNRIRLKKQRPIVYIPLIILIITFAAFMLGLFKYEPVAIVSNSMNPVFYRGDVVILRKVDKKILKNMENYTIIVYRIDNQQIVHRVVDIIEKDNKKYFKTKGDANNTEDLELVSEEQVVGIYQFSLKYIGYPSVWLNEFFKNQTPKVEIK